MPMLFKDQLYILEDKYIEFSEPDKYFGDHVTSWEWTNSWLLKAKEEI